MPGQSEHEAHCLEVLGRRWPEVHRWLDQYFLRAPSAAHRIILHHQLGIELGVKKFGEESRKALELHVLEDFRCILPGPLEIAMVLYDKGYDILPAQVFLDELWPGKYNIWDID